MADFSSSIGHRISVDDIAFTGETYSNPISNELDYFGVLLGLQRLKDEKNAAYKERLFQVFRFRANSTYSGLLNGITRELGLSYFKPITITLKSGLDPSWIPKILFIDGYVYIWKDSNTNQLDKIIDRSTTSNPAYFLSGLVNEINNSSVFNCVLNNNDWAFKRSETIATQSNLRFVEAESLNNSQFNSIKYRPIEKKSFVFSDTNIFQIAKTTEQEVSKPGEYYINYNTGYLYSHTPSNIFSSIQYKFINTTYVPIASPIIIQSIASDSLQAEMFNSISGTPTALGASIINELLSVTPLYWGI